ncbi:MAG: glycine cleavage system aminomethyltransferase GcvT [Chromatiales bacterium]
MNVKESAPLLRTPLHALHVSLGARMAPFAGYEMPIHYGQGIVREHLHTRAAAGLFDVSHMGQIRLTGKLAALERLCPIDVTAMQPGRQRYSFFTTGSGGILDDLMVTRVGDHLLLVVNAARRREDVAHLRQHLRADCCVEELSDRALLALQGPAAAAVLARLAADTARLVFMTGAWFAIADAECFVTRSGYTGEDGFEISVPVALAEHLARALLAHPEVAPAGLGARDSLRLEAGMCLHGHDIDATTTPVEANLGWAIPPSRREGACTGGFPGSEVILPQLREGASRKRVGLIPEGRIPVREGAELLTNEGEPLGRVTSGGFSPTLNRPIAMGYVNTAASAAGTPLGTSVRSKPVAIQVARLPFVTPRYHRG